MMEDGMENSMILVTVNQGFTEEVMETARKAGARGGTIIHARWAGSESTEEFYGITVQQEKEIIAIISPADKRNGIMEDINSNHCMKT
ncbi:MAG: P-II family nitrogen regulator, partial [Anaerotignum sp.]|nr:P-II family nitrogen regulator [Anaerotignum sp.]